MEILLEPVPYSDPWLLPLRTRLSMLAARRRRVAYFYEEPNNSTFRYRAYNMAQVLQALGAAADVSASYFFLSDHAHFDEIAELADVLVVCRSRYGARLSQLVAKFRARGRRVLFDVDDLVFDPAYTRLLVRTLGLDAGDDEVWDYWFAMTARLGAAVRECDGVIATNDLLASRLQDYGRVPASVVPNFLNREQMEISDRVYAARETNRFTVGDEILLGYFSGSPSHRLDYALMEDGVAALLTQDSRLRLVVVGYIEPTEALRPHLHRIVKLPFQDYVNLQRVIGSVHINLMPLQKNAFTDCKSELKFFDAAAVGTISIASPSYTYERCIEHGRTGYLCKAHEWTAVMQEAIERLATHAEMAARARKIALDRFCWAGQLGPILTALGLEA